MITKTGAERIAAERLRQVTEEQWPPQYDDDAHCDGELAIAAACYAAHSAGHKILVHDEIRNGHQFVDPFPWEPGDDKRYTIDNADQRIRVLEKAGALIAAEIDRILREKGLIKCPSQ